MPAFYKQKKIALFGIILLPERLQLSKSASDRNSSSYMYPSSLPQANIYPNAFACIKIRFCSLQKHHKIYYILVLGVTLRDEEVLVFS